MNGPLSINNEAHNFFTGMIFFNSQVVYFLLFPRFSELYSL